MRRRDFIKVVAGSAIVWPLAVRAQQPDRSRRIGALMNLGADDLESQERNAAFLQRLSELGWTSGRNVRIDYRWAAGDAAHFQRYSEELLGLDPDVILAAATPSVQALQRAARTVPIVFVGVTDPVGAGFVESLAHPGGNVTGFTPLEYGFGAKWLELLEQIVPGVTRVAVFRESTSVGVGQFAAIQTMASSSGVELSPIDVSDIGAIERGITSFARGSNGGVIVTSSPLTGVHRDLIIMLASRHRLPAVYPYRYFVLSGGLISYGPDLTDEYRRAADYIDRILKGEKPSDMPVQAPTKYELVINLKTAKALNLMIPQSLLTTADEVIE